MLQTIKRIGAATKRWWRGVHYRRCYSKLAHIRFIEMDNTPRNHPDYSHEEWMRRMHRVIYRTGLLYILTGWKITVGDE